MSTVASRVALRIPLVVAGVLMVAGAVAATRGATQTTRDYGWFAYTPLSDAPVDDWGPGWPTDDASLVVRAGVALAVVGWLLCLGVLGYAVRSRRVSWPCVRVRLAVAAACACVLVGGLVVRFAYDLVLPDPDDWYCFNIGCEGGLSGSDPFVRAAALQAGGAVLTTLGMAVTLAVAWRVTGHGRRAIPQADGS